MSKRRWLQFHLSTVLLMMSTATILVGANAMPHCFVQIKDDALYDKWNCKSFGWPTVVYTELRYTGKAWESYESDMDGRFRHLVLNHTDDISKEEGPSIPNFCINVTTSILIVLISGVVSEFIIRRREALKI